jgi:small subunit ribosomal protein S20
LNGDVALNPGLSLRSNPGLKLANAFGVFEQRLRRIRATLYARFMLSYYGGLPALTLGGSTPILRHLRRWRWARIGWVFRGFWRYLMPNHKSSEKRVRQSEKRRVINRSNRTKVRTYIKKLRAALESGNGADVQTVLPETISVIDKAVQKGVMHKNAAARYKSRLTVRANQAAK